MHVYNIYIYVYNVHIYIYTYSIYTYVCIHLPNYIIIYHVFIKLNFNINIHNYFILSIYVLISMCYNSSTGRNN